MKSSLLFLTISILLSCMPAEESIGKGQGGSDDPSAEEVLAWMGAGIDSILRIEQNPEFTDDLRLASLPPFAQLAVLEKVTGILSEKAERITKEGRISPEEQDAFVLRTRKFERLAVEIMGIGSDEGEASEEDQAAVVRTVERLEDCLIAYRRGLVTAGRLAESGVPSFPDLDYGQIREGAESDALRFTEFLIEWQPIGKRAGPLRGAIGKGAVDQDSGFQVRFDTGWGGSSFRFVIEDGIITSVRVAGLY